MGDVYMHHDMHDCAETQQMSEMLQYYIAEAFSTTIPIVFSKQLL